jgi:hypothetical protein
MDLALRVPAPVPSVSTNHECPPHLFVVRVDVWLEKLFGRNIPLSKSAVTWTKTCWLNFTHFARVGTKFTPEKPVPLSVLAQAWTRGVALLGVPNQQDTDAIFVGLYSEKRPQLTDVVKLENIRPLLLQIKNVLLQSPPKEDKLASQDACLPPGTSSLSIYVSTDARVSKFEAKTLQREPSKHAIYIGGSGSERFPLINELDKEARELLPDILGRWKHNEGISHTPRMTDFLNGRMHLEGFPESKGIPLGKVRQADNPEPATSSAILGSARAKKQKTRKHKRSQYPLFGGNASSLKC